MKKPKYKLPEFIPPEIYNAFCVKCGWKGISTYLIRYKRIPDQCSRCHRRGTLRSNQS